jgi:arabinogalactan endo-1,4-beta-galactosidase
MNRFLISFLALFLALAACSKPDDQNGNGLPPLEIKGTDMSFLPEVRQSGLVIRNADGQPEDMLLTLQKAGANTIRLRLWVDPSTPTSGFSTVKSLSQEIKGMGMKVMLSMHYSDNWADPGSQTKPARWQAITFEQLKDSVYAYTQKVAIEMQPEYIQIGNEINGGLLWPEGRYDNPAQMRELLAMGIAAVRDHSPSTKIILHYAGHQHANSFFSSLSNLDYDIIGMSYYPFWHGKNLSELQQNLAQLASQQGKPVFIAETSYPFTLEWNDWTDNVIGHNAQILDDYPATPEGQRAYLLKIREIITGVNNGIGFCYWGAEWISYMGSTAPNGSSWENQALWNFNRRALPAIEVFGD